MSKRKALNNNSDSKKLKKYFSENKLQEICRIVLSSKNNSNVLIDLLEQFHKPKETPVACVNAVENVFTEILNRRDMAVTETDDQAEIEFKKWLGDCYEDFLTKLLQCLQKGTSELNALNCLFKFLAFEAKYPFYKKKKRKNKNNFPIYRLQSILQSIYLTSDISPQIVDRLGEYLQYKDVCANTWLALDVLLKEIMVEQPEDRLVWNILLILAKMPKIKRSSDPSVNICDIKNVVPEEKMTSAAVTSVWKQLSRWHYTPRTHQLLLVVLVEHMMPLMDNVIFLTDYFMDALDRNEREINMLALQGIFNLVTKHNIEYPDIYGKLYQLFSEDTLKTKYKTRLFSLTEDFLRSTHLPLALVAAFAKRFARLSFTATHSDLLILLTFIANLLIRHPDLTFLCPKASCTEVNDDPYLEEENDPYKSKATESQLWEVSLLQHHYSDMVSKLATSVINELPSAEYGLDHLLDLTWLEMISKDIKLLSKKIPKVVEKFDDKPLSNKMEEARKTEIKLMCADLNKLFVMS